MQKEVQRLLYLLKKERRLLQERVTSVEGQLRCENLALPHGATPTTSYRVGTRPPPPHKNPHAATPTVSCTASASSLPDHPTAKVASVCTTVADGPQTSVGSEPEKQLVEETTALKEMRVQLGLLEQYCQEERLLWDEELKKFHNELEQTKGTLRSLCRENIKLKAAIKLAQTEEESLKRKNAELTTSLEESKLKYRKVRVTVLATKGRAAIERRRKEALEQVKQEAGPVRQDKVKPTPDRTQSLKGTISKKDEIIASYLTELTELQVKLTNLTETARGTEQALKERDWQISDLQSQLETSQAENTEQARGKEEQTAKLQQLQSRYLDATGCLEVRLTKTEAQLTQVSKALQDSHEECEHQQSTFTSEKSELMDELMHAVQSSKQQSHEIARLKQSIDNLKSDLSCERVHTRRIVEASAARCQELAQRACLLELEQSILLN